MELFTLQKDIILGFKTTIVLDYNSMTPVAILIHPGAPPPMIQDFFWWNFLENIQKKRQIIKNRRHY